MAYSLLHKFYAVITRFGRSCIYNAYTFIYICIQVRRRYIARGLCYAFKYYFYMYSVCIVRVTFFFFTSICVSPRACVYVCTIALHTYRFPANNNHAVQRFSVYNSKCYNIIDCCDRCTRV